MFRLFSQYKPHLRTNKSVMESCTQKIINDAKADLILCDEEVTQAITHLNDTLVKKGKAAGRETETITTLVVDVRRLLQFVLDRREEAEEDIEVLQERQRHDMARRDIKCRINSLYAHLEEQKELLTAAEQNQQRNDMSLRDIKGRINLLCAQIEEQQELLAAAEEYYQDFRSGYVLRPAQQVRRPVQELKPIPTVVLAPRKPSPKPRVPHLPPAAPLLKSVDLENDYLF